MIEIRPATAGDLQRFEARRFDRAWTERLGRVLPDLAGPALAAAVGGRAAMIAGLEPLWPGVAEAWAVTTPAVEAHPVAIARAIDGRLPALARELGLHRVQASVHYRHGRSRRWLEWMGFRPEGLMQGYGPDKAPYWLYARQF